jgi:hypothetical protein
MKKLFSFLPIVLLSLSLYGQAGYQPIPIDSAAWRYRIYDEDFSVTDAVIYSTPADTIAFGHTYSKLFSRSLVHSGPGIYPPLAPVVADHPDLYYGAIRDSAGKIYHLLISGEELIFNFNAGIGDTIPSYVGTTTVTAIDSIAIGGVLHKRWITSIPEFTPIEGIGSNIGVIPAFAPPHEPNKFICYSHYDSSYVPDATFDCTPIYPIGHPLSILVQSNDAATVFPVPMQDVLQISAPATGVVKADIYNIVGQKLWSGFIQKNASVSVKDWLPGVYILQLAYENTIVKKVIVK